MINGLAALTGGEKISLNFSRTNDSVQNPEDSDLSIRIFNEKLLELSLDLRCNDIEVFLCADRKHNFLTNEP
jgi:hypothetical protein